MMIRFLVSLFAVLAIGCDQSELDSSPTKISGWDGDSSVLLDARVIGYRFLLPGEGNEQQAVESGFSLISNNSEIDFGLLKQLKQKEAILTKEQVAALVSAVYGDHEELGSAACYEPHHVFLFFDEQDVLINVVEICFSCTNLHASPELSDSQWSRHDFRRLARLCDEIGIGMASGSAEDFIRLLDERGSL